MHMHKRITVDPGRPLGIKLGDDGRISVAADGGQCSAAGVCAGDLVTAVGGQSVEGKEQISALITAKRSQGASFVLVLNDPPPSKAAPMAANKEKDALEKPKPEESAAGVNERLRVSSKSAVLASDDIETLPPQEIDAELILAVQLDTYAEQSATNNMCFLRLKDARERMRWQAHVEQTRQAYSFPIGVTATATAMAMQKGGGSNGGGGGMQSGFTADTVRELERLSGLTVRMQASSSELFGFMISPEPAQRAVIRRTVAIYQQLAGRDLVTTTEYAQGYYSFLLRFLQSPALRAFLFVCDWQLLSPPDLREFMRLQRLTVGAGSGSGAGAVTLLSWLDWVHGRLDRLFQPVAGASGAWWRVMFRLFLDSAGTSTSTSTSKPKPKLKLPAAYTMRSAKEPTYAACFPSSSSSSASSMGGLDGMIAADEMSWLASESTTRRLRLRSMHEAEGLLHSDFSCVASLMILLHVSTNTRTSNGTSTTTSDGNSSGDGDGDGDGDGERAMLRRMLADKSISKVLRTKGVIPGLHPRAGSVVTAVCGPHAGKRGQVEFFEMLEDTSGGSGGSGGGDRRMGMGLGRSLSSRRSNTRKWATVPVMFEGDGAPSVPVPIAVEHLQPQEHVLLSVTLHDAVDFDSALELLCPPDGGADALLEETFGSFAEEAMARRPHEFERFVRQRFIDDKGGSSAGRFRHSHAQGSHSRG
eukprot:g809.t1